jgi:hypothetical protein
VVGYLNLVGEFVGYGMSLWGYFNGRFGDSWREVG